MLSASCSAAPCSRATRSLESSAPGRWQAPPCLPSQIPTGRTWSVPMPGTNYGKRGLEQPPRVFRRHWGAAPNRSGLPPKVGTECKKAGLWWCPRPGRAVSSQPYLNILVGAGGGGGKGRGLNIHSKQGRWCQRAMTMAQRACSSRR